MYASLYLTLQRIRVLELTIDSDIRALMKLDISKYLRFSLLLGRKSVRCYVATAYVPGIMCVEYTIGFK